MKLRIGPMLGFKRFETAAITIAGVELLLRIGKGQFNLGGSPLGSTSARCLRCSPGSSINPTASATCHHDFPFQDRLFAPEPAQDAEPATRRSGKTRHHRCHRADRRLMCGAKNSVV